MVVLVTAVDQQGLIHQFHLMADLEPSFSFLDSLAKGEHTLIEVSITEGHQKSHLSADLLQEPAWRPALDALQTEWQRILSDPGPIRAFYQTRLTLLNRQRAERHQICITRLEQLVINAQQRLERALARPSQEPYRSRVLWQLEAHLKRLQQNLISERAGLSNLVEWTK